MKNASRIRTLKTAAAFTAMIAVAAAAGCASAPLKTEASTSGIRAAEEVGASKVPRAALHLQLAKEELANAEKLAKKGDRLEAASLLMRAEADAEIAVALSREDSGKKEGQAAIERVRQLRKDNQLTDRNSP
jgi:hypothetical protein